MKKTILLFTLVFFSTIHVFAQYEPLVVEDAHWSASYLGIDWWVSLDFNMKGDTIVNGMAYKKLYYCQNPAYHQLPNLYALMREDTIDKKVYTILMNDVSIGSSSVPNFTSDVCEVGVEHLFFDYSVAVGDTIDYCWTTITHNTATVDSSSCVVESIGMDNFGFFPEDVTRKYIGINCTSWLTFDNGISVIDSKGFNVIEGLGTDYGPILPNINNDDSGNPEFIGYQINPDYDCSEADTDFHLGISHVFTTNDVKVFPSPVSEKLYIELEENVNAGSYQIVSMTGQTLLANEFVGLQTEIDVRTLTAGIYFIQIFDDTKLLGVGKILVR